MLGCVDVGLCSPAWYLLPECDSMGSDDGLRHPEFHAALTFPRLGG